MKFSEQFLQIAESMDTIEKDVYELKTPKNPDPATVIQDELNLLKKMRGLFSRDLKKIRSDITKVSDDVEKLSEGEESLRESLEGIEELVEESNEDFDRIINELESVLLSKVEEVDQRKPVAHLGEEIKKLAENMSTFPKRIEEVRKELEDEMRGENSNHSASFKGFHEKFLSIEKDIKKLSLGLYQYGSSFGVSVNGKFIGTTAGVNFKAGTNITITQTVDSQGTINLSFAASGGGSSTIYTETPSGAITGSNKAFNVLNTITSILGVYLNGQYFHPSSYTVSGSTITFGTAPDITYAGLPFTVVYM